MIKVFTVRDAKADAYLAPFFMKTKGLAIRGFETTVNDQKTEFNKYPEDYDLYQIGEYDEQSGKILSADTPEHICKAVDLKEVPQ